jgi:hypothetical protein
MINRRVWNLLLIAGLMLAIWGTVLGQTASGAEFSCRDRLLFDYSRVLKGMPSNHLPGQSGLPFGPADLGLKAGRSVVVEGEPISFTFMLNRSTSADGHLVQPANLGWTFALTLDPVNRLGHPMGIPERRRWRVKRLRDPKRRLTLRAGPGLYRASVTIREGGGRTLAIYRQFLRVLPLRERVRIEIRDGTTYQPGDTVAARIENHGTREAALPMGSGLVAERLEGETWVKAEADGGAPSVMFEDPEFLPRGRASGCSFFTIPPGSASGLFRFNTAVQTGSAKVRHVLRQFVVAE